MNQAHINVEIKMLHYMENNNVMKIIQLFDLFAIKVNKDDKFMILNIICTHLQFIKIKRVIEILLPENYSKRVEFETLLMP